MATLQDFENRIGALGADFVYLHDADAPAVLSQIEEYENETGIRFPAEFVQFLTRFGNAVLEISPLVWPRSKNSSGYGFCLFGLNNNPSTPDWIEYGQNFDDELCGQAFFERAGGLYNAYLRADGKIFTSYDRYDTWEDMEPYEGNLFDYLLDEIGILEETRREYASAAAALDRGRQAHAAATVPDGGSLKENSPEEGTDASFAADSFDFELPDWGSDTEEGGSLSFAREGGADTVSFAAADEAISLELPDLPESGTQEQESADWLFDQPIELPETPPVVTIGADDFAFTLEGWEPADTDGQPENPSDLQ